MGIPAMKNHSSDSSLAEKLNGVIVYVWLNLQLQFVSTYK